MLARLSTLLGRLLAIPDRLFPDGLHAEPMAGDEE